MSEPLNDWSHGVTYICVYGGECVSLSPDTSSVEELHRHHRTASCCTLLSADAKELNAVQMSTDCWTERNIFVISPF